MSLTCRLSLCWGLWLVASTVRCAENGIVT